MIKADDLYHELTNFNFSITFKPGETDLDKMNDIVQYIVNHSKKVIEEAQAVYAEPVVRCKDCKWFYETKDEMDSLLCLNRQWDNGQPWRAAVKPDDFCSYGERKEPDNEVSES